jgi:hypothetical protein
VELYMFVPTPACLLVMSLLKSGYSGIYQADAFPAPNRSG